MPGYHQEDFTYDRNGNIITKKYDNPARSIRLDCCEQILIFEKITQKMKLTKRILMKRLRPFLQSLGYTEFRSEDGTFCKKIDDFFFLCINPTIHRYYDDWFTIDYYLSDVMTVYCHWKDIPLECEARPGFLLSPEEILERYGEPSHDVWWHCFDDDSFSDFCDIVRISEPRMLERREFLREKLSKSIEVANIATVIHAIVGLVNQSQVLPEDDYYKYTPRFILDTPLVWFHAAEYYLRQIEKVKETADLIGTVQFYANLSYFHSVIGMPYIGNKVSE